MEEPMLKFPPIHSPSNTTVNTARPFSVQLDTNSYEQWRASIHQQLEEDLQRQVRELLEETERQERLAKLEREKLRYHQRPPSSFEQSTVNPSIYGNNYSNKQLSITPSHNDPTLLFGNSIIKSNKADILTIFDQQLLTGDQSNTYTNKYGVTINEDGPFWPENYRILHPTPRLLSRELTPKEFYLSPSVSKIDQMQSNSFENENFVHSSKRLRYNPKLLFFSTKQISINPSGPFWPIGFPIHLPLPSYLSRSLTNVPSSEEYYHILDGNSRQTYDNQPAIYKYTENLRHTMIIYDMDKSARYQLIKSHDNEHLCPQLIFESRFEGGNLRQVKRVGQFEYELILRPDLYTRRHTQWYYFRVQNMIANVTYRFRIINLMKKSSLYSEGMQTLLFSEVDAKRENRGWYRVGHHINYSEYKPRSYNILLERDINYFELDFQCEFPHSGDTCYIAHCYPYTFTDLKGDLDYLSSSRPRDIFRRDVLCESQAGNSCFIITVTDESVPIQKKKIVFVTARIHPGETNSSYMMRGLLEFITSDDKIAQKLRSQLVFKIIPMLNPDGVIVGNYRCSLTGRDMNRNFRHPRKQSFPIIYHMKELIQNLQRDHREILAFCDLHGHSRKSNVFAYGCDGCDGPQPDMRNFLNARVLPYIMSKTAPDMFAFDYCKFNIHRCKESTGRVVMWKEMCIKNSFTLEASFAGSSIVERPCHFNIQDYEKFGQCICQSLRQYLEILADSARLDLIYMDITRNVFHRLDKDKIPAVLLSSLSSGSTKDPINSVSNCIEMLTQCRETIAEQDGSSSSDSDSDPEGGELPDIIFPLDEQTQRKKLKKKRSDRNIDDRKQKSLRKRHVNRAKSVKSSTKSMDKAARMLPERGALFTSKYAHRTGNGLPIFTTERAAERRHQKTTDTVIQDTNTDRQTTDEYETDNEPTQIQMKSYRSQAGTSTIIEQTVPVKRTASLVSLQNNSKTYSPYDPSAPTSSPTSIFKGLPARRLQQIRQRQQLNNPKTETEQTTNIPPPIITIPNLMEFSRRLSRSSSIYESDTTITDPPVDSSSPQSFLRRETPIIRSKKSIHTDNGSVKRGYTNKLNGYLVHQPLNSTESVLKERSVRFQQSSTYTLQRANQVFKKQIYLPFERK